MAAGGRPIEWTEDKREAAIKIVLAKVRQGSSLRRVFVDRDKDVLPSRKVFNEWLDDDAQLCDQYVRACAERADYIFEEMLDIADDGTNDYMKKKVGDVEIEVLNNEHVQRSKLRIDARKWMLSKMMPKKYGDRIQQDHTTNGKDINSNLSTLSTDELLKRADAANKIEQNKG